VPASSWGLPPAELEALFAEARAVEGCAKLVSPAPHHVLLILARLTGCGPLSEKRRARLEAAVAEDPGAWERARQAAPAWRLRRELAHLRDGGEKSHRIPRPRRPKVIALSGIDGSGKSSQAELLRGALERLGYDAAVEWSPYGQDAWLGYLAAPVKRLLRRTRRYAAAEPKETGLERTSGTALREWSAAVNYLWSAVVTLAKGLTRLGTIAR
jgi:hypothetical protein